MKKPDLIYTTFVIALVLAFFLFKDCLEIYSHSGGSMEPVRYFSFYLILSNLKDPE